MSVWLIPVSRSALTLMAHLTALVDLDIQPMADSVKVCTYKVTLKVKHKVNIRILKAGVTVKKDNIIYYCTVYITQL